MKTSKFVAPILIVVSLFAIWRGLTADLPTGDDNVYIPNPASQVAASISIESGEADTPHPSFESRQPDDPYLEKQWALGRIQASESWQVTPGGRQQLVAILDTGIDPEHEDLNEQIAGEINFTSSSTPHDIHGHGTHIAGIIAATSNNGLGISGMAPESRLLNVKVADDKGQCCTSAVAKGIIWAVDNGASVINISLELREPSPVLENAVDYAWNKGAVIIAAAGNDGSELPVYPASYKNCIAVTALQENETLAPLSNHGDWVDVAAPGFNICSTLPGDSYGYKNGTSSAAAYVSGLATLLFNMATDTNNDTRVNDEVRAAIEAGCQEIGIDGTGKGLINAADSMAKLGFTQ